MSDRNAAGRLMALEETSARDAGLNAGQLATLSAQYHTLEVRSPEMLASISGAPLPEVDAWIAQQTEPEGNGGGDGGNSASPQPPASASVVSAVSAAPVVGLEALTASYAIGTNFLGIVSQHMMRDPHTAFEEFVVNGYDHDATEVGITVGSHEVLFQDNGTGMSPVQVADFFRAGDSVKVGAPVSPLGRQRIGKFGIATLLAYSMGEHMELVSVQEGIESRVAVDFTEGFSPDRAYDVLTRQVDAPNGTSVLLRGLKESVEHGFYQDKFLADLGWKLPIGELASGDVFNVGVNGVNAPLRPELKGKLFVFDETGEHMGRVHGTLHYFSHQTKHPAGVHLYVNERRVDNPDAFFSLALPKGGRIGLAKRVVGIVQIDDFNRDILFDRERLRESRGYKELVATVKGRLNEVRQYHDWRGKDVGVTDEAAAAKLRQSLGARKAQVRRWALQGALGDLSSAGVKEANPDRFEKTNLPTVAGRRARAPVQYRGNYQFEFAADHPLFAVSKERDAKALREGTVCALIDAIALRRAGQSDSLGAFLREREGIWDQVRAYRDGKAASTVAVAAEADLRRVFPSMRYTMKELSRQADVPEDSLHHLVKYGGLPADDRGGVVGADYTRHEKSTKGLVSLYDFMEGTSVMKNRELRALRAAFEGHDEKLSPFLLNLSTTGDQCYFVDPIFTRPLKGLLEQGAQAVLDYAESLKQPWSLDHLETHLGINQQRVASVTARAGELGIQLAGTEPRTYLPVGIAEAYQHVRGNRMPERAMGPVARPE